MIKAIIFDCFGVLTTDTWKEFAATIDPPLRHQARQLNQAYGAASITKTEFMTNIEDLTGSQPTDIDLLLQHQTTKNRQLLDFIQILKKDFKIGILSNIANNWVKDTLLTKQEQKLFDSYTLSYEVKMTKPDPRIFKLAAKRLGVDPAECIFVDDVEHYCLTAEALGMKTVVYQNFKTARAQILKLCDSKS
ncbi:MAG: hypothetical protein NVS1B10_05180 [Candidatus Saccharimonadales bacterium]